MYEEYDSRLGLLSFPHAFKIDVNSSLVIAPPRTKLSSSMNMIGKFEMKFI